MIHFKKTKREDVFEIFDDKQPIGKFCTKFPGAIVLHPKDIYRKLDAFGLNKELLTSQELKFKWTIVYYEGKGYYTSRENLIKEGIEVEFNFGTKIFLPRKKWETNESSNQLQLEFKEETI